MHESKKEAFENGRKAALKQISKTHQFPQAGERVGICVGTGLKQISVIDQVTPNNFAGEWDFTLVTHDKSTEHLTAKLEIGGDCFWYLNGSDVTILTQAEMDEARAIGYQTPDPELCRRLSEYHPPVGLRNFMNNSKHE